VNHSFYPDLTLEILRDLGSPSFSGCCYTEREVGGSATASFPFSQLERSHALSFSYQLFSLAQNTNPYDLRIATGSLAAGTIAWSYSDARRFVKSISSEEGQRFSLALRVSDPALGSSFSFWQLSTALSRYFRVPFTLHHALALRASFGISRGDLSLRHLYSLGGFQQGDPIRAVINPTNAPARVLRGFANGAFWGEEFALGTAEYRFPIWTVERGPWTLPFFLRRFHGAVYSDVGDAWTAGRNDFKLHAGAGAELRAEVVLGYILPTDLRLGCARGLENSRAAILDCYAALGGVF
jgi:outer membrane protein assembly factor BamA